MKTRHGVAIAVALAVGAFAAPASADTVANFTLDNVTFSDGGTATGSFTLDLDTSALSNIDITTSVDGLFGVTYFGGSGLFGSTSFTNSPTASFAFDDFEGIYEADLVINLGIALTPADLTSPNSFSISSGAESAFFVGCNPEDDFYCGDRTITGGSLDEVPAATPLPATLPLFAGGLGFVGYLTGRKKRKAGQALSAA